MLAFGAIPRRLDQRKTSRMGLFADVLLVRPSRRWRCWMEEAGGGATPLRANSAMRAAVRLRPPHPRWIGE